jgi:hypothetical protein
VTPLSLVPVARSPLVRYWALALLLLIPIWAGAHFPTEDGPAHLHWTEVYRDLANPHSQWAPYFERSVHWNAPNLVYFGLQYTLSSWMDPHTAQKVILSLLLLAWAGSAQLLAWATNQRLTLGAFAALLLFHNWILYSGFLSFLVGVPVLVTAQALLARGATRSGREAWSPGLLGALSVLGILAWYSHLVAGCVFVGLVFLRATLVFPRAPRDGWVVAGSALPTCGLLLSYVFGRPLGEGGAIWAPLTDTIMRFAGLAFWRGFAARDVTFFLSLALEGVVLITLCLGALRAYATGDRSPARSYAIIAALAVFALYLVVPRRVGEGSLIRERVQLIGWALLLPVLGGGLAPQARRAVGWSIALLALWQLTDFTLRVRRFNAEYDSLLSEVGAIPAGTVFRFPQAYENSGFERTWVGPLMEVGADIAQHRHAILVGAHHPGTPFYWIHAKADAERGARLDVTVKWEPGSQRLVLNMKSPGMRGARTGLPADILSASRSAPPLEMATLADR